MAEKKTHAKKEETNNSVSESVSTKDNNSSILSIVIVILVAFQLLVSVAILIAVSGDNTYDNSNSDIAEKVTRIDNFFAANFEGYLDSAPAGTPSAPKELSVNLEGVRSIGDENAPVTIVKYSDFRCGFCGKFDAETYPLIYEEYIKTGKVRFIYKDFPVVGGVEAANAAWCAYEQNKFWEFKEGLFNLGQSMSASTMLNLAESLGMDTTQYSDCVSSQKYMSQIEAEAAEAQANGVTGTPAFVIEGELIVGAQPYQVFKQSIEANLN